nr:S-layer homology domain-containing protein [uncultured Dysosmobacter sp.]
MRRHKLTAVLLALVLALSLLPAPVLAAESDYRDTDGHWAETAIDRWSDYGIIQGSNGLFNPNGALTRAHMAAILTRLLDLPAADSAGFADVQEGDWFADSINRCAAAGIMQGTDGRANPNARITRQQAIVMLARALGIQPVEKADLSAYKDGGAVSAYARGYVAAMLQAGIVNGVSEDTLGVGSSITRAATVTILDRAITTYVHEPNTRVEAVPGGIVLVAAENVELTGSADTVLVAQGAGGGTVRLKGVTAEDLVVTAAHTTVVVDSRSTAENVTLAEEAVGSRVVVAEGAQVGTVTTQAPRSTVSVSGKVDDVITTESAQRAEVEVSKDGRVGEITVAGEETDITVSGKVDTVTVEKTAEDTTVEAGSGASIGKVDTAAEGTTVSGSGKVENVTTSGDNTTVTTKGTEVEVEKGTTGTTAGGKDVAGGTTTTTPGGSTSGGSSSGGSSSGGSVHSHSYAYRDNGNGTHTGECSCGATVGPEAHKVGDAGTCTVCGAGGFVARIGTTGYKNLQDALDVGGEVVLVKDVIITPEGTEKGLIPQMNVAHDTVLNLNGKTISVDPKVAEGSLPYTPALMSVPTGVTLTINGPGTITAEAGTNNSYGINVMGGHVIVNGGNHYGSMTAFQVQTGELTINDGLFDLAPTCKAAAPQFAKYMINVIDKNYKNGTAIITVKGGTFVNFDPSANPEGQGTSYVAPGYSSVKDGENYKVLEGTYVSTEEQLNVALSNPAVDTVYLADDITLSAYLEIKRSVTMIGADGVKTLSIVNDGDKKDRVINITGNTEAVTLTLKDLNIVGPTSGSYPRGISAYANSGALKIVLDNCSVSAGHYPINIASDCPDVEVTVKGGTYKGYCAMQTHSPNTKVTFEGCTLIGDNVFERDEWNRFATVVINTTAPGADLSFKNCRIEANNPTGNTQYLLSVRASGAKVTLDGCTYFQNGTAIAEEKLGSFLQTYTTDLELTIDGTLIPIQ